MADMKTAFHIVDGAKQMYAADAAFAVRQHPGEWSYEPWSVEDTNRFRRAQYDRQVEEAKRNGVRPPPKPDDLELTDDQQSEVDEDAERRTEAAELVRKDDEARREQADYERRVADARTLLASAPVQPVPSPPAGSDPRGQIVIPGDWEGYSGPKKRSLAMRLGSPSTVTVAEAEQRIKEESQRRSNAPAQIGADNPSGSAPTTPGPSGNPPPSPPSAAPAPNPQPTPSATFENPNPAPPTAAPNPPAPPRVK